MGGKGRGWETQTLSGRGQRSPAPRALWRSCQSNSPQGHQKGQPNKDGRQCVWSSFIYRTSSIGKEHWLRVNQPACDCVCWFCLNNWYSCSVPSVYIWLVDTEFYAMYEKFQETVLHTPNASLAFKYCQGESFRACYRLIDLHEFN